MSGAWPLRLVALAALLTAGPAHADSTAVVGILTNRDSVDLSPRARHVLELRAAEAAGVSSRVAAVLAPGSRVWFEVREGPGEPRDARGKDSFADWDRFFRARKELTFGAEAGDSVVFLLTEDNDFYRLLMRPPSFALLVYWFDAHDRITGTLVRGIQIATPKSGPRPRDRMADFKAWENARNPQLLAWLLPAGRLDPDLAHARRWREELNAWRKATGLPALVTDGEAEPSRPRQERLSR